LRYLLIFILLLLGCEDKEAIAQQKREIQRLENKRVADSILEFRKSSPKLLHTELQAGEGVFQVLERIGLNHVLIMDIINKLRFEVELMNLRAGERFTAIFNPDSTRLLEFHYKPNRAQIHKVFIKDSLEYEHIEMPTKILRRMVKGTLAESSTLNQSLLDAGFTRSITQVVNGILLCKISFRTDARVNDTFTVMLEEQFYQDTIINSRTKVLYTSYQGRRAGSHEAYRYQDSDPKSSYNAHYTPSGEALVFSGLRYPVDRLHISSSYGMRIHPVTGGRKMHYGVDYAGRTGTPVYAVASGKVVVSGYDKYSGNKLAVRHADGSTSYYLHLSKRSVSLGQQVRSRQVIGKIGRTGRVTGPHLHFGFKKPNGKWMNPLQKRMIATPKLKGKRMDSLKKQIASIQESRKSIKVEIAPKVPLAVDSALVPNTKKLADSATQI
jgi:murein DD-endopeptidase MepM/ murein hydrolase activator NlpD